MYTNINIFKKTYFVHLVEVSLERSHLKEEEGAGRSLEQHLQILV